MGSTFTSLHYHVVFSTKNRQSIIDTKWRPRFHEYLGGTVRGLEAFPEGVGGTADHVHLLIGFTSSHCLADFMRELKKSSTAWVRHELKIDNFAWQKGYGAFTVSPTARAQVKNYIANQEEHHRVKSFREEMTSLLDQAGIQYDPQWLD